MYTKDLFRVWLTVGWCVQPVCLLFSFCSTYCAIYFTKLYTAPPCCSGQWIIVNLAYITNFISIFFAFLLFSKLLKRHCNKKMTTNLFNVRILQQSLLQVSFVGFTWVSVYFILLYPEIALLFVMFLASAFPKLLQHRVFLV